MGLSNFPGASEGVLTVLVMNTVLSVALIKSMLRSLLHVMGVGNVMVDPRESDEEVAVVVARESRSRRVVSVVQYKSMSQNSQERGKRRRGRRLAMVECCVCLCGFEAEQEVSELSCTHLFHKGCLENWFDNDHATCPLCRSVN